MQKYAAALVATMLAGSALAHDSSYSFESRCDIDLNHDVRVSEQKLTVSDGDKALYRIEGQQLWVNGEKLDLNRSQTLRVGEFRQEMATAVPEVAALVDDGLSVAVEAVEAVLTEMKQLGVDDSSMQETLARAKERVADAFKHEDGSYEIKAKSMDKLSEEFDEQLSEQISQLVSQSVGSLLSAIGTAMTEGDMEGFGERMDKFGRQMEQMGERIEKSVSERSVALEKRADDLCHQWKHLNDVEKRMHEAVPELEKYDVITSKGISVNLDIDE